MNRLTCVLCVSVALAWAVWSVAGEPPPNGTGLSGPLPPEVARGLKSIQAEEILAHARVLCDRNAGGRRAGEAGTRRSAAYLAERFAAMGLRPGGGAGSFYDVFRIRPGYDLASEMDLRLGGTAHPLKQGVDYMPLHVPGGKCAVEVDCAFAGYGISSTPLKFDEYGGLDAQGKAVLVFSGVPWDASAEPWIRGVEPRQLGAVGAKARNAADHGAVCLLVADDPGDWSEGLTAGRRLRLPETDSPPDSPIPVVHVAMDVATTLLAMSEAEMRMLADDIERLRQPQSMPLRARTVRLRASLTGQTGMGRNVIGVLPGRDDARRREAVVIGAHYDHLGEGRGDIIFFSANDNAAGVGALLAAAQAFAALPQPPRRTLIFIAFDAEELGRLGSRHYVEDPLIPIGQTTLMVNFDMIGRNEPDHIYAVGTRSSDDLHQIHQEANAHVGLRIEHPPSLRLGRSDHSSFYQAKVPILYLFGGIDPDYNTTRDTVDKLIPAKVENVARLAFLTAWAVAERPERLRFQTPPEDRREGVRR